VNREKVFAGRLRDRERVRRALQPVAGERGVEVMHDDRDLDDRAPGERLDLDQPSVGHPCTLRLA
jgi:hypothetical protein